MSLDAVPQRLRGTAAVLSDAAQSDERVTGAWLEGSIARGDGDAWSDLDLHLRVDDPEAFEPLVWGRRTLDVVLADTIPGAGASIFVTPDWVHVDLVLHPAREALRPDVPRLVLLGDEPAGAAELTVPNPSDAVPRFPDQDVHVFLYLMGVVVAAAHRQDAIDLARTVGAMRDQLITLMLAETGVVPRGTKRLGALLSAEQRAALAALPPIGIDVSTGVDAARAIAADFIARGRGLAITTGASWPEPLASASAHLWHDTLGDR